MFSGIAPGTVQLEERTLLAAVTWDGGGNDFNWTTAANWSDDTVPDADDNVTIDFNGNNFTITIADSTVAVNKLNSNTRINVFRSTVQFDEPSNFNNGVDLTESTFQLGGNLTLTGTSSAFQSTITSTSHALVTNEGSLTIKATVILQDTDFENAADATVIQSSVGVGYSRLGSAGTVTVTNSGDWTFDIEENRTGEISPTQDN